MPTRKERKLPKIGSVYAVSYKGRSHELVVVKTDGGVGYSVSGKTYKTPTAAAKSLTKHEINGWRFWKID